MSASRELRAGAVVTIALVVGACGSFAATPRPKPSATSVASASTTATASVSPSVGGDHGIILRWFIGCGSGTQPTMTNPQTPFVQAFNARHTDIYLEMEIVPNAQACEVLKTEIATGRAPDVIGPVGVRGRNGFAGQFLDLTPLVAAHSYDTNVFPEPLVRFFQEGADGQIGLPYTIYPGFLWYNADLFDKAGLPYPPARVGELYEGKTWDWAALTSLARKLTADMAGRRPGEPGFDPAHMAEWGIDFQWTEARRMASTWGAGSFVAADGRTAQIPDAWRAAWTWYHDAMWTSHIAPTAREVASDYLNAGTTMSSGHIAMGVTWGWALNSLGYRPEESAMRRWNIAVIPSYEGQTSSPLDADTFTLYRGTPNPDQAFDTMLEIMADPGLRQNYGGAPGNTVARQQFNAEFEAQLRHAFPDNDPIRWDVQEEMIAHPAVPSHEADMPNYLKVIDLYSTLWVRLQSTQKLDMTAELATLQKQIQAAFDEARK